MVAGDEKKKKKMMMKIKIDRCSLGFLPFFLFSFQIFVICPLCGMYIYISFMLLNKD
jgi:hypothetical protein